MTFPTNPVNAAFAVAAMKTKKIADVGDALKNEIDVIVPGMKSMAQNTLAVGKIDNTVSVAFSNMREQPLSHQIIVELKPDETAVVTTYNKNTINTADFKKSETTVDFSKSSIKEAVQEIITQMSEGNPLVFGRVANDYAEAKQADADRIARIQAANSRCGGPSSWS